MANNGRPEIEYLSVQIIAVFQVRLLVTKVLVAAKLPILGIWVLVVVANAEMVFDVQLNMGGGDNASIRLVRRGLSPTVSTARSEVRINVRRAG